MFVHLNVHSEYSLSDGLAAPEALVQQARALGMPAIAVTDRANLFGLIKFYKAARSAGIKPIAGAELRLADHYFDGTGSRFTALAQNATGYRHLTELISLAYQQGLQQGEPLISEDWLVARAEGLILLSGGREGQIGRLLLAGRDREARACLEGGLRRFPRRYFVELHRTGRGDEALYLEQAVDLAYTVGAPPVATNDVRFLDPSDFEAHEARVCIHQGRVLDDPSRPRGHTDRQYLRSATEMAELFADLPAALDNAVEIAKRCNLELRLGKSVLPDFPVPATHTTDSFFLTQCQEGLRQRLADSGPARGYRAEDYQQRLALETDVIQKMGFPGYFLIVADFIQWAKTHGVPVGPGRGSGAGSLAAYALGITDLDPLPFDLLFERFLNPERVSMPDFDVDFCMEGRDRVIEYVADKYGRDKVAQIITFGSMAAKAVVRDVGRVLGHPYGFVDKLAKLIPFELGMTLDKALADSEELRRQYETDEEVRILIDLARKLEGIARNAGKHAGGVVIARGSLTEYSPLFCVEGDTASVVTQFDKDDVEAAGLVKFDFLGLRTLTIIDWALAAINQRRSTSGEPALDIRHIPLDDPATFKLLQACKTTAVFQLESRGMKELIRRLKPDCFEDIIALVALFRPGPLQSGMVDDYINVKHGKQKAGFPHPVLEPILKPTNGVIVYQEQVMQIARDMAGYTLGGADLLRRAMGKKKPEEMAKQRAIFVDGAIERGVDPAVAGYIFDLMEKFAGYGFNKSHSAAYALVSYQTAWLKAHYPAEFMAAVLSSDMDNTDKIVTFINECDDLHLAVLPPDVNRSGYRFAVDDDGKIVYGLGAIKGMGESAIAEIIAVREAGGRFSTLTEFCQRVDVRKVNRRALEALTKGGAMDGFGRHRAQLLADLPDALQTAEQHGRANEAGQDDLFGLAEAKADTLVACLTETVAVAPWPELDRLREEKAALGLYLSGHPVDPYAIELRRFTTGRVCELANATAVGHGKPAKVVVAGLLTDWRTRKNKQGKRMGFGILDDHSGRLEVALFADAYEQAGAAVSEDQVVIVEGTLEFDDYSGQLRLNAERLLDIEQARAAYATHVRIAWDAGGGVRGEVGGVAPPLDELQNLLKPYQGGRCPVVVEYRGQHAKTRLCFGEAWRVRPGDELLERLRSRLGADRVMVDYT